MINIIVLSVAIIVLLLVFNSFVNHICGFNSSKEYGKVLEATSTIIILYFIILTLWGNNLMPNGVPFLDKIENYESLTDMFKNHISVFVIECAELISLTFIISLLSNYITDIFGGSGITAKVFRSIILVLIGIVINNYFLALIQKNMIFAWAITGLQCFLSGTAMLMTPAMLIGKLLQLSPDSGIVAFLLKELPKTKIGKSLSTAATNSLILVFVIMMFESQYGNICSFLNQVPIIISMFIPIVIMIIGMRLIVKAIRR